MQICTIIFKNYLAFARVLARSFAEHHPEGRCTVLVIDGPDPRIDPADEPFDVILPGEIGLDEFERMAEDYDVTELSTAVKPWLMRTLLDRHGAVSYLDPDIRVYGRMDELQGLIERHGIVLLPHFTGPLPLDGRRPSENDILIAGSYNLGYLGLGDTAQARELLDWWSERLLRNCLIDPARGYFVDQRWIDLVPGRFDSTAIFRDPGHDVAYWNLPHRRLGRDAAGGYTVEGVPLKFFHFSGFDPNRRHLLSKHQDRVSLAEDPVLAELCRDYAKELLEAGHAESSTWRAGFDLLEDPRKFTRAVRRLRTEARESGAIADPVYTAEGRAQFLGWLRQPARVGAQGRVNRYLLGLWESRPDLRAEFPDLRGGDADRYVEWAQTRGLAEPSMIQELVPRVAVMPDGTPVEGVLFSLWLEATRRRALSRPVDSEEGAAEFVAWLNEPADAGGGAVSPATCAKCGPAARTSAGPCRIWLGPTARAWSGGPSSSAAQSSASRWRCSPSRRSSTRSSLRPSTSRRSMRRRGLREPMTTTPRGRSARRQPRGGSTSPAISMPSSAWARWRAR